MKPALRVAVLGDTFPPRGHTGVGNAHYHLLAALKRQGLDARGYTYLELPRWLVVAVKALVYPALWLLALLRMPGQRPGLRRELAVNLLGALGGLRVLWQVAPWDPQIVITPDYGAAAAFWPRRWRRRVLMVSHSNPLRFLGRPELGLRDELDGRLAWRLEARVSAQAQALVAPSRSQARRFMRDYPRRAPVAVIPNLLDDGILKAIPAARGLCPGARWRVFIPAAGNHNKGVQFVAPLIRRVADALAPAKVGFVLSGPLGPGLSRELQSLPVNAIIEAPGDQPYARNIALTKACDLCVSPTLIDSFGLALLEAQFCGIPVVAFKVDGVPEVVAQGKSGLLAPLMDGEALALATLRLLKDAGLRRRLGKAAASRARAMFSSQTSGRRWSRLLRSLGA